MGQHLNMRERLTRIAFRHATDPALAARVPRDLNPWAGFAVLALHSHTAEEDCDDRCSVYER